MKKTLFLITLLLITTVVSSQNALNFDGTNDFVQTTYDGVLGRNNRTFEAWIFISPTAPTSNLCILDYGLNTVGARNTFAVSGGRSLNFTSGGTNANISTGTNLVPVNQWVHVAFVLNSGTGYLYINGVQSGTGSLSSVNTPTTGVDMLIGNRVPGGNIRFNGSIDEVRIWDVARTAAQIAADTAAEICLLQSNLKAYYRFNEGVAVGTNTSVTSVIDFAGTNNGTFSGLALTGTTSNYVAGKMLTAGYDKTSFKDSTCGPYTTSSGTVYTTTGVYYDTLTNATSCDSLVEFDLSISTVDDSVSRVGGRMTAFDTWASHQWVRCDSNFKPIAGATNRIYDASLAGDYAVIVTKGACVDTSDCINISLTSLEKNSINQISIYPNPASNVLNIVGLANQSTYKIYSISGKLIESGALNESTIDISTFENGVYFLQLESKQGNSTKKFVKK